MHSAHAEQFQDSLQPGSAKDMMKVRFEDANEYAPKTSNALQFHK
jgi:hypothetical protein